MRISCVKKIRLCFKIHHTAYRAKKVFKTYNNCHIELINVLIMNVAFFLLL